MLHALFVCVYVSAFMRRLIFRIVSLIEGFILFCCFSENVTVIYFEAVAAVACRKKNTHTHDIYQAVIA